MESVVAAAVGSIYLQTDGGTGPTGIRYYEGIYRAANHTQTDIVYIRNFRVADTEDSL